MLSIKPTEPFLPPTGS